MSVISKHYNFIKDTIHRKPPTFCSHKAIVRHLSFWVESDAYDIRETEKNKFHQSSFIDIKKSIDVEFEDEKCMLDDAYRSLIASVESSNLITELSKNLLEIKGSYKAISGYDKNHLYNRIIISRHYNRVSVKHIVDLGYKPKSNEEFNESNIVSSFEYLENKIREYNSVISNHKGFEDIEYILDRDYWNIESFSAIKRCMNYLYFKFWNDIDEEINYYSCIKGISRKTNIGNINIKQFSDFRGVLFPSVDDIIPETEGRFENNSQENEIDYSIVKRNWPIIKGSEYDNFDTSKLYSFSDIIACSIDLNTGNSPGVYVSTLGQDISLYDENKSKNLSPIKYLILSKTTNYRQLGRIVDNIDRMGVYRLVALRDSDKLNEAGKEIQKVEEIIDRCDHSLLEDRDFVESIVESIDNIGNNIEGGIVYRLAASKHYAGNLKRLIKDMNFRKIHGFESYEEFVGRKLFQIYDYHEIIDDRLHGLRKRKYHLLDGFGITGIQKSSDEIVKISQAGEIVEIFAVTYYLGTMIKQSFSSSLGDGYILSHDYYVYPIVFIFWMIFRSSIWKFVRRLLFK